MWSISVTKRFQNFLHLKRIAVFEACVIGLVSGLAAVLLKQGVGWLGGWRIYSSSLTSAWLILPIVGVVGGWLSGFLIEQLAPEAAGSGIPQVKAALAEVPMRLDLRVALVKLVSTCLALGSGLALGRQGPTVHVGAAIAAQLSRWVPTSSEYRRQLIAAGAAAGLAAGFNAPIAGVLFVIEELLQDVSGLTLGTAILASFIGAVVSRLLGGQGLNLSLAASRTGLSVPEIPLFLLLGLLAGLLGVLFSRGIFVSLNLNRNLASWGLPGRMALAGLLSGLVVALLPPSLRDNAGLQEFLVTGEAGWRITAIAFLAKFILTLVAYGSGAPGGLFAPSLVLGSALGYLVCLSGQHLGTWLGLSTVFPIGSPETYALAGMGAFFSAVARGPITAIVIVFEMTTDFNLVLPLMVGSVTAYLVAESFSSGSLYKQLLDWNGIDLEHTPALNERMTALKAADLMQSKVETLTSEMTVEEALQAFARSHHRGFPITENSKLIGIITQTDLTRVTQALRESTLLKAVMTAQPVTVNPSDSLSYVLYLLNHYKISRLPVTEGRKLVGIITRADIIRAESDRLGLTQGDLGPRPAPSYGVYQTRAPETGRGRLLVPLSNPQTAPALLQLAAAIALEQDYELECLQVLLVSRHRLPSETPVRTTVSRRLLTQATRLGKTLNIPVHTQVRVSHDVAQAILETIKERHIDLLVMGWKGSTATPGRVFGGAVDTLIRQAACEVVVVKYANDTPQFNRWLVPIAGGPNAQQALQLLPSLITLSTQPEIRLCQVFHSEESSSNNSPDTSVLQAAVKTLHRRLKQPILTTALVANSVPETVLELARTHQADVIVLGATREGLLQQAIKGNIPEAIARNSPCNIILVRGALN